ncbi:MAG: sulfatase-like hydrolase/transferase, partial [Acidobacteriota bacterium]
PGLMVAGASYPVRVKFRNTGSLPWNNDSVPGTNFKLGYDAPSPGGVCPNEAGSWNGWRIDDPQLSVSADQDFVPDESPPNFSPAIATFEFDLVAPTTPGVYPLGFRMFQGGCSVGIDYFGEASDFKTVRVVDPLDLPDLPNIVHIVLDDLDYCDFAFLGNPDKLGPNVLSTPHVESLVMDGSSVASDVVLFERYYSNGSVCSPTRASLQTGKSPLEFGFHRTAQKKGLPEDQVFLAELLKAKGYTTGHFGKWHVGSSREEHYPTSRGVDESTVFYTGAIDYEKFTLSHDDRELCGTSPPLQACETVAIPNVPGCPAPSASAYVDDAVSNLATDFICRHKNEDQPFFLNVWFYTPHTPFTCPPDDLASCPRTCQGLAGGTACTADGQCPGAQTCEIVDRWDGYQKMVTHIDSKIQEILDELGVGAPGEDPRETLVILSSDNGGEVAGGQRSTCADPLNPVGRKADFFERSIRVPLIMRYGGFHSQRTDELALSVDLVPTVLDLVGYRLEDFDLDGETLLDLLESGAGLGRRGERFFWEGKESVVQPGQALAGSASECEIRNNYAALELAQNPADSRKLLRENPPTAENVFLFGIETAAGFSEQASLLGDAHEWDRAKALQDAYFEWRQSTSSIPYRVELAAGTGVTLQSTPQRALSSLELPTSGHDGRVLLEEDYRFDVHNGDFTLTATVDLKAQPINTGGVIAQKNCSWDLSVLSGPNQGRVQLRVWHENQPCPSATAAIQLTSDAILTPGSGPTEVAFTLYGHRDDDTVARLYVGDEVSEGVVDSSAAGTDGNTLAVKLSDHPIRFGNNDAFDVPTLRRPFLGTISEVDLYTVALYKNELPAFADASLTCLPPRPAP